MTQEELSTYHEAAFDAFCKRVIRNASKEAHRKAGTVIKKSLALNEALENHLTTIQTEDTYSTYSRIYHVRNFSIEVKDETVGEALQFIMPNKRAVLLLSYFGHYSDAEIAYILGITAADVGYRKKAALTRLRELLEARRNGN